MWLFCLRINSMQIAFDNVFGAKNTIIKIGVSYWDVRNQVANDHYEFSGWKIKATVVFDVLKDEKRKEAITKVFRDLKARNKVQMKYLKVKITGVWVSKTYRGTSKLLLAF